MRMHILWISLCCTLFFLSASAAIEDGAADDDDYIDINELGKMEKKLAKMGKAVQESRQAKKARKEAEEDAGPYEICTPEPCICDEDSVICDDIVFPDESQLSTLNLATVPNRTVFYFAARGNYFKELNAGKFLGTMAANLNTLDLSNNKISRIENGAFASFTNLTKLILSKNNLKNLSDGLFSAAQSEKLLQLRMDGNDLRNSSRIFRKLKNLKKLILDNTRIHVTKELFEGLENLEELSLDYCNLGDLMDVNVFDNLPKLRTLSLIGNVFTEVPRAIQKIENLKDVDLSKTHISELHRDSFRSKQKMNIIMEEMPYLWGIDDCAFCDVEAIGELNFEKSSHLYDINRNAFGRYSDEGPSLIQSLKLAECNISTLYEDTADFDDDTELTLHGNPIQCDCNTVWLTDINIVNNAKLLCAAPKEFAGKHVHAVPWYESCPDKKAKFRAMKLLTSAFVMISASCITYAIYVLVATGRLQKTFFPASKAQMNYTNLSNNDEQPLERDFQPRIENV